MAMRLRVAPAAAPGDLETATTENISRMGARVLTRRPLQERETVFVTLLGGRIPVEARVVYCQALEPGHFSVGLVFGKAPWALPSSARL